MASPAAETMQNGISTPPATTAAQTLSPPTQPSTQQVPAQTSHLTNGGNTGSSYPSTSLQDNGGSKRPRDARLIHLILANMGVHAYTERVPLQLLDLAYRYTSGVLSDAVSYEPPLPTTSGSSKKRVNNVEKEDDSGISLNALRTAVGARAANQFSGVLGKEFMADVASERNRIALPRVDKEMGIRLPPERYCFTGVGWGIKGAWESEGEDEDEEMDEVEGAEGAGFGGPVSDVNGTGADTTMGGMEEEEQDDDEFEEAMGIRPETHA